MVVSEIRILPLKENFQVMDVTKLPFNEHVGLKFSDNPGYLLMLENITESEGESTTESRSFLV